MEKKFKCLKCNYEYIDKCPTICPKCNHDYVEWINYKEWKINNDIN